MPENDIASGENTLALDSDLGELDRLREFIEAFCAREGVADSVCYHLSVALEELAVNAIRHGNCDPRTGAIRITLRRKGDRLEVDYSDTGVTFDPLAAPPPDLTKDLGLRPIGGLGIHLVRCLMPEIRYERRNGCNCLLLAKPLDAKAAEKK